MPATKSLVSQLAFGFQAIPLLFAGIYYSFIWKWTEDAEYPLSVIGEDDMGILYAMSTMSLILGIFYALVAYQNNTTLMAVTIPTRLIAAALFHGSGEAWQPVAKFEVAQAVLTVVGVWAAWRGR
ncbi:hypothetical protein BJY01DRAFT_38201 [Aspergillus pseudoustus]|uniref:EamA domain-containing protein n=1 Tax=Aspergillus pseudoustus TaxID=1810923 RepID=A0ABR4JDR0_9EURO